ncbi:MAG: FAD binding domain-containing protein [Acidimicrobiales bacterium]
MNYLAPTTVDEAVSMLTDLPEARVFAGATDVIPQIRSGRPEPAAMIDLKRITRLMAIREEDDRWVIGAAVPTARLTAETGFVTELPGLAEAAGLIGSDQIQNRSSLGGNLANASPAADSVPAMIANHVRAVVAGPGGTRTVTVADVPTGPGRTCLGPGEFIVEFEVDRPGPGTADAYLRLTPRTEMDIAVVGAGARIELDPDGVCSSATLALGAVAPTAVRVPEAEQALVGAPVTAATLDAAAAAATAAADPIDDKRGTIAYRRRVAGVLTRRAVLLAAERARSAPTRPDHHHDDDATAGGSA